MFGNGNKDFAFPHGKFTAKCSNKQMCDYIVFILLKDEAD